MHRRPHYDLAVDFLKALYLRHLPRVLAPDELLQRLDEAPDALHWSPREASQLCLSRAKAHEALGDPELAREWVETACSSDPQSSRARRWAERVGLESGSGEA
jgi:hypothetical protein